MNQSAPPSLPPGWVALWDETSQRYYYLEQATGLTQWDIPSNASKPTENANRGEANSYNTDFATQGGYQSYPQQQPGTVATSYPTQQTSQGAMPSAEGDQQDRGLGKIMHGFSGGAITGSLIGFAAGKLLGNHNKPSSGHNSNYNYAPPPQYGYGGGGGGYNYGPPPPSNYGPPGYSNHAPHAPHGHHGNHGHHGGHHNHGW